MDRSEPQRGGSGAVTARSVRFLPTDRCVDRLPAALLGARRLATPVLPMRPERRPRPRQGAAFARCVGELALGAAADKGAPAAM